MAEKIIIGLVWLLILIAYGIAGEIEYQDQLEAENFAIEYYAGVAR